MKDYKVFLISFVLLFFIIGAVSATSDEGNLLGDDPGSFVDDGEIVVIDDDPGSFVDDGEIVVIDDDDPIDDNQDGNTKEIYVNDTGDDDLNTGSADSPYASLARAFSEVQDPSESVTVHISQGTFLCEGDGMDCYYFGLPHFFEGGSLSIVGAGADKTILDGQSMYGFAVFEYGSYVTLKDLTLKNFRGQMGTLYAQSSNFIVDNCVFENCYSPDMSGGAISLEDWDGIFRVVVTNSKFISTSSGDMGGAINAMGCEEIFLENNTFINTVSETGRGVAVYANPMIAHIFNNTFINITGTSDDASIWIDSWGGDDLNIFANNTFINCSNPSTQYLLVLSGGRYIFENNTFINSSGYIGAHATIEKLNFDMDDSILNIGINEINKGVEIPINVTDDMGNTIEASGFTINFINENNTYNFRANIVKNVINKIFFDEIPESGIYNFTITFNGETSKTFKKVNVTLPDAVEFWVSPEGFDGNNGSSDNPFKTIQHALDVGFENAFSIIVHLANGTYSGQDNVELNIAERGTLKIIGEDKDKTVIDGKNTNWFLKVQTTNVEIDNVKFINGKSNQNLITGNNLVVLKDCIFDNNTVAGTNSFTLNNVIFDNLEYTNNYGRMYFSGSSTPKTLSNSLIENNTFSDLNAGGIIIANSPVIFDTCRFINNSATMCGVIDAYNGFVSRNNYYANNNAIYMASRPETGDCGVIRTSYGTFTFENDTYVNNYAINSGVIGISSSLNSRNTAYYAISSCRFINNSAEKGGVLTVTKGSIDGCEFINNSADYGGAIAILPVQVDSDKLEIKNTVFDNNVAKYNGNDIYLDVNSRYSDKKNVYKLDLTIDFNDLNTTYLSDVLNATIVAPCGAQVGGSSLTFLLNGTKVDVVQIENGHAKLNYGGFEEGKYNLSGYMDYQSENTVVNDAVVEVKLENILDNITFWVSADDGSDVSGNGSENNPFKSISHAITEASKNTRNIIINIASGIYAGDLNTGLFLSSLNNITLVGAGMGSTIIDGENTTNFATITLGQNTVTVSDLTIQNMLPDNKVSRICNPNVPITINEGANLVLDGVEVVDNHGGESIIKNNGNLIILNSKFNRNGLADHIISGGNVTIDNSVFDNMFLKPISGSAGAVSNAISADNLIINNSEIKNGYILFDSPAKAYFALINKESGATGYVTIENTKISHDGSIESLNDLGVSTEGVLVNPALDINGNVYMNNCSMENNYNGTLNTYDQYTPSITFASAFGYTYTVPRNVTALNSTFINYYCLWMATTYCVHNFVFDGCVFENLEYVAWIRTNYEESNYNITNSVFINCTPVINQIHYDIMPTPKHVNMDSNYWGTNNKTIVYFLSNSGIKNDVVDPNTWVILTEEDGQLVFKLTDGENTTAYEGSLPAKISYVADENGDVISVVNIAGTGYKLSIDENGNIVLNTTAPMKNIVPKVAVDETVFADDMTVIVNDGSKFTANFTDKWGDPLKNTNVSFKVGENTTNATTDANGSASFDIDFALGSYSIAVVNPVTGQSIDRTISVKAKDTTFASDVNAAYGDASKFEAVFTDEFGVPLANANVTFKVGNDTVTAITDVNGTGSFIIDLDAGNYTVTAVNPATGQEVTKNIMVSPQATKLTASKLTMVYNTGKYLKATLTDANGKALANKKVTIKINGKTFNKVTNDKGQVSLKITLAVKTYTATITFAGDNNYLKSTASPKVVVKKATPKIVAKKKVTFKAKKKIKKFTITLKDNKGKVLKKAKVTLKIKGKKLIKVTTNKKGKATFKITKLTKKGKYTAKIKALASKNFKAKTVSVKITVKK